jgi:phasin family protein
MAAPIDPKAKSVVPRKPKAARAVAPSPKALTSEKLPDATPPAPAAPAVVETAVSPAPAIIEDKTMNETIKNVAEKVEATAKETFAKFGAQSQTAMEKGKKGLEDYAAFQKGNVEALVESGRIAAKGMETLGQDAAAFAKKSYDHTSETLKAMAAVKSPTELMKLQADYFRSSFDALVAQTSRTTEAQLKLAGEIAQPLQNRFALAAEKLKVAA